MFCLQWRNVTNHCTCTSFYNACTQYFHVLLLHTSTLLHFEANIALCRTIQWTQTAAYWSVCLIITPSPRIKRQSAALKCSPCLFPSQCTLLLLCLIRLMDSVGLECECVCVCVCVLSCVVSLAQLANTAWVNMMRGCPTWFLCCADFVWLWINTTVVQVEPLWQQHQPTDCVRMYLKLKYMKFCVQLHLRGRSLSRSIWLDLNESSSRMQR